MTKYTVKDQIWKGKKTDLEVDVEGYSGTPDAATLKAIVSLLYYGETNKLHKSKKITGVPDNTSYLHVNDNELLEIKSQTKGVIDAAGKVTTVAHIKLGKVGKVKSGVHQF
jgi:hypothetical protein